MTAKIIGDSVRLFFNWKPLYMCGSSTELLTKAQAIEWLQNVYGDVTAEAYNVTTASDKQDVFILLNIERNEQDRP